MKRLLTTFTLSTALLAGWAENYMIQVDNPRQTILHFGASDAWSMQSIGTWPEEQEQAKIADWLFSMETDAQGQPRGIGLSLWRFNLGAGSSEQGRDAQINRDTRTECFLQADGTYEWTKQAGQRKFLRMAKERGVPYFLAFLNSPPVYFTQNGLATNTGRGGTLNLKGFTNDNIAHFIHENGKETMAIIISVGILYYGSGEFFLSSPSDEALEAITNEVKDNLPDFGYEPMDNVLGHYYRQMYHTVKYVLQPKWLTEEERYGYVKLLRAQMSDYEQMMLYYNSLSINGFAWKRSKSKTEIEKMSLIARFRLIKNIPYHYDYFYFHPSDLFVLEKEAWKKNGKLFFENEIYTM